jgi:hypothetical protein
VCPTRRPLPDKSSILPINSVSQALTPHTKI